MNRKTARENAFILLFELVSRQEESAEEIFELATGERGLECDDYVRRVFFGVNENLRIVDEFISNALEGWKSDRISNVSRAICRLATYELMFLEDIPKKVSINEAIELSKKYDDDKAYSFVNGVLNRVADEIGKK